MVLFVGNIFKMDFVALVGSVLIIVTRVVFDELLMMCNVFLVFIFLIVFVMIF